MKHYASPDFWELFYRLPVDIQLLAKKNYELLKQNPRHPSLHFKKVKAPYWSVRVSADYRALAIQDSPDVFDWFWIGTHAQYDRLIR
ncbi:MAG: hypothetical protein H6996_10155 [Moraxellaceae bacterium]|nr:hypothetical protein [Pseudomonadales bacterium]MCB1673651.1 hypothetical protein [Pseudomonadales bacterium]MCP5175453.1 hypothetical protein [Moraxellaceae bacterium]MCP5176010.1 hypothetical protein [Moraxellaceae bacterium]